MPINCDDCITYPVVAPVVTVTCDQYTAYGCFANVTYNIEVAPCNTVYVTYADTGKDPTTVGPNPVVGATGPNTFFGSSNFSVVVGSYTWSPTFYPYTPGFHTWLRAMSVDGCGNQSSVYLYEGGYMGRQIL